MALDRYFLHEAARSVYQFFWHEFCDWSLEMIKLHPERSMPVLTFVFECSLRLLHPFMPFITEELWQRIPHNGESIAIAPYPESESKFMQSKVEADVKLIQEVIIKVRNIRAESNVEPKQFVTLRIAPEKAELEAILMENKEYIHRLARVEEIEIVSKLSDESVAARAVAEGVALEVPLDGIVDVEAEMLRLQKELDKAKKEVDALDKKLSNREFINKAPVSVVDENRRRLSQYQEKVAKLSEGLSRFH